MKPSRQDSRPADSPQTSLSWPWKAGAIACLALAVFAPGLYAASFVDEYAYIAQSFYADLFFEGQFNHPLWLKGFASDLQPLPKYLIGLSLRLAHLPMPTPADAAKWYGDYAKFGAPATLIAARLPFIALGALGCVAIFACGVQIKDGRVGTIAAALLMLNPLYRLHAHRAMSDVPCEAFMLVALGLSLWGWRRTWYRGLGVVAFVLPWLAGLAAGLSLLCKFNGFLGLMIIVSWCGIACVTPGLSWARKIAISAGMIVTILVALATFVALNPFLTARPGGALSPEARDLRKQNPWGRFLFQVRLRGAFSDNQKINFPNDALFTIAEKTKVVVVQGFGRFGPFGRSESDSTVRFHSRQDWGMILWVPLVLLGLIESLRLGRSQLRAGRPPAAIALVVWTALAWTVVTVYLPMAWDRYLLPIQSGNALLAALAASTIWDRLVRRGPVAETGT
ncbi:MAG: ArnT family glycosyltransferase [Isosphaerales bacterium]